MTAGQQPFSNLPLQVAGHLSLDLLLPDGTLWDL